MKKKKKNKNGQKNKKGREQVGSCLTISAISGSVYHHSSFLCSAAGVGEGMLRAWWGNGQAMERAGRGLLWRGAIGRGLGCNLGYTGVNLLHLSLSDLALTPHAPWLLPGPSVSVPFWPWPSKPKHPFLSSSGSEEKAVIRLLLLCGLLIISTSVITLIS